MPIKSMVALILVDVAKYTEDSGQKHNKKMLVFVDIQAKIILFCAIPRNQT